MTDFLILLERLSASGPVNCQMVHSGPGKWSAWLQQMPNGNVKPGALHAIGEGASCADACAAAVRNYQQRQNTEARKAELLQIPEVIEALTLGIELPKP